MRPMACDTEALHSKRRGLSVAIRALELFSYLVRFDAVFVAGVAAA